MSTTTTTIQVTEGIPNFRDRWAAQERNAEVVNARALQFGGRGLQAAKADLVLLFKAENAEFPQYDGWTDDTVLVRMTKTWKSKGGEILEGDLCLAQAELDRSSVEWGVPPHHSVFSPRLGHQAAVEPSDFEVVG